jgi:hypothetical protein
MLRGMNVNELMAWDNLTQEQAEHVMNERVYGVGYQIGKDGNPIERGIGSAAQQSESHKAAVARERARQALRDK